MRESVRRSSAPGLGLVAATFTAFDADGALDLGAIERQAELLINQRLRGAFICGTSGEFASLTVPERMAVARRWQEVAGDDLEIIVHVGHTSLDDGRALAAHAEQIGVAGIAAVAPYYFRPRTVAELVAFSARLASAAPSTPCFFYHIPSLTGVALPMATFLPAAEAIPSFAGIKFTDDDLADYARCIELAGDRYEVFFGRDEMLLGALGMGASSAVGTTYNFAAPLFQQMFAAFAQGALHEARRAQGLANRMIDAAIAYGGLPAFKAMMGWFGVDCGPCRPPLATLDDEQAAAFRSDLEQMGFFAAVEAALQPVPLSAGG